MENEEERRALYLREGYTCRNPVIRMSCKYNKVVDLSGDGAETVWKKIFKKAQNEIVRFNKKAYRISKNEFKTHKKNLFFNFRAIYRHFKFSNSSFYLV